MIGVDRVAEKKGRRCPALGLSCGLNAKGECGLWRITVSFANPSLSPFHQRFLGATTKTPAGPTTLWLRECPMSGQYLPRTPSSGALQASKIIGICKTACCSTDPRQSVVCHVYITVNNRYLLMKMLFSRLHHHFPKFPLASSNFSPSSYQRSLIVPAPSRATESQHAQRHLHRELYLLYLLSRGVRPDPLHPLYLTGMDCILAFSASSSYVSVIYPIPHMGLSSWNFRWTGSRNRGIRRSGPASLDVFDQNTFTIYFIGTTIGPAFFSASIYLSLARIIPVFGADLMPFAARTITFAFMFCDFVSLLLQAIGGAMTATASTPDTLQTGINIMIAGLASQVASMSVFVFLCLHFSWNIRKSPTRVNTNSKDLRSSSKFQRFLISKSPTRVGFPISN